MKVLYIDHDAKFRNYISMLLEGGLDLEVLECSSGNEALAVCEMEEGIDFVISEVKMPNGNGDLILNYFDQKKMPLPFLWISEKSNENAMFVQESLNRNTVNAFIPKPFKDTDFFPHIEKVLNFLDGQDVEFDENEWDELEEKSSDDEWKSKDDAVAADWSLKRESKASADEKADWSLNKKNESDWDGLKKIKKPEENLKEESTHQEIKEKKSKRKLRKKEEECDFGKYRKIKIKRFYPFNTVPCDVFVRLSQSKYVQIIKSNELYDSELLDRYSKKNLKYFYVTVEQHPLFIEQVGQEIFNQAEKVLNSKGPVLLKTVAELSIFNHVTETVKNFGINENNAKKISKAVDFNLKTLAGHPNIFEMLAKVIQGQSYLAEHSLLLSYIAGEICLHTSWSSNQTLEKLSMAALLHDVAFEDKESAEEHDKNLDLNEIEDEDREFIENHPGFAAKLISSGKSVFPDVDTIVLQHHEKPDGSGYPRKLGHLNISPLSCILIIAEDFVVKIYGKRKEEIDIEKIRSDFKNKYDKGNFKKPLQGFLSAFKEV